VPASGAEASPEDRQHQSGVPAKSDDLAPVKGSLDGELGWGLHEVVRHPLQIGVQINQTNINSGNVNNAHSEKGNVEQTVK
jgi:hypothetical protein